MYADGGGGPSGSHPPDEWDIAVVVVEFDVADTDHATRVAEALFAHQQVLTVRVGGPGERTVFRVDVPRGDPAARLLGVAPADRTATDLGVELRVVRVNITRDGRGDPYGDPLPEGATPWLHTR